MVPYNHKATKLFQEAIQLRDSLLQLYFDTCEHFGPTKYNSFRVAKAVQSAFERVARRRDKILRGLI